MIAIFRFFLPQPDYRLHEHIKSYHQTYHRALVKASDRDWEIWHRLEHLRGGPH